MFKLTLLKIMKFQHLKWKILLMLKKLIIIIKLIISLSKKNEIFIKRIYLILLQH